MNIMMLLAHPGKASLNHAIANAVLEELKERGDNIFYHDLYAEEFDPLITAEELGGNFQPSGLLKSHCDEIMGADGIIIIHPNYRNQPPAILKGWVDRVVRSGVCFRYEGKDGEEGRPVGLLKAGKALIINTADCSEEQDRSRGFSLKRFWDEDVFSGCGVKDTVYQGFYSVLFSSHDERTGWLDSLPEVLKSL